MGKHPNTDPGNAPARPSRRPRLHALVFACTALATTMLTLGGLSETKLPPFKEE